MSATVKRSVAAAPAAMAVFAAATVLAPAISSAAECGPGTVYDASSDMCVGIPVPPGEWNAPQAPPVPAPPAVPASPSLPPISICPPIPFVPVCFPVN